MTRAERELAMSLCRVREFRGKRQVTIPSRFLAELPDEALSVRDLSGSAGGVISPALRRQEPRPRTGAGGFRLTTAASLGGSGQAGPPDDLSAFQPGVPVLHPQYGLGRIIAIDGAGPDRKGRVAFAVGGERTFVLSKSPLRPVTRG
jgi:DNA helicase-2/ATP-dependent DNA helicase PcrA